MKRFDQYLEEKDQSHHELNRRHSRAEALSCANWLFALFLIYLGLTLGAFAYSIHTVNSELASINQSQDWCQSTSQSTCGHPVTLRAVTALQFVCNLISYFVAMGFCIFGLYVTFKRKMYLATALYRTFWVQYIIQGGILMIKGCLLFIGDQEAEDVLWRYDDYTHSVGYLARRSGMVLALSLMVVCFVLVCSFVRAGVKHFKKEVEHS